MTGSEMVTEFKLGDWSTEGVKIAELIKALREHTKGIAEEYDFVLSPTLKYDHPQMAIPARYSNLVAYAIEGGSEGYYVHVGCILQGEDSRANPFQKYLDFGFAKTYSAESAYKLATEAQRFLTAARWN